MLSKFFPQDWRRYQSLPMLGPRMDGYAGWLDEQQYTWRSARYELRMAERVAGYLSRRGLGRIEDLDPQHVDACHRWCRQKFPSEVGAFRLLVRFLRDSGAIAGPVAPPPADRVDAYVRAFMAHLDEVRGYAPSTVRRQGQIAAEFLDWLRVAETPERLSALSAKDLEGFAARLSKRMGRVGLQKPVAILRNLLCSWLPTGWSHRGWMNSSKGRACIGKSNFRDHCPGQRLKLSGPPLIAPLRLASVTSPCFP